MQSFISAPHCLVKAFEKVETITGPLISLKQTKLSETLTKLKQSDYPTFLDGMAHIGSVEPINKFLKDKGFSIQLPTTPSLGSSDIAMAGVLDVALKWNTPATICTLPLANRTKTTGLFFAEALALTLSNRAAPIIKLDCESSTKIKAYVTLVDTQIENDFISLQEHLQTLTTELVNANLSKVKLTMPAIDLNVSNELKVFNDNSFRTETNAIFDTAKGICQGILKANEKGARAKAAAAGTMLLRSCLPPSYPQVIINSPFWFWIELDGIVYFAAQVNYDAMKLPVDLS